MTKEERAAKRILWEQRIADFKASGLSRAKWCAAHKFKTHPSVFELRDNLTSLRIIPSRFTFTRNWYNITYRNCYCKRRIL